ncbi:MAG: LysR family transcriptional regulator [Eubacteriales bacterium]|nr:LysR family transcriptional regulator [Eubacteriales bacterium]
MNTVQLECFLAVASNLNFARAAAEVHMSQPAVTHQIRSLETELNVRLFKRSTRSVSLTYEGHAFLPDAQNILHSMRQARARMQKAGGEPILQFSIGCHSPGEFPLLQRLLTSFRQKYPLIHPVLKTFPFRALENMLEEEAIDLMFYFRQEQEKSGWRFDPLLKAPLSCILSPNHPAAGAPFSESLLERENLVLVEPRRQPRQINALQSPFVHLGHPSRLYFCESIESAMTLVRSGYGISVVADLAPLRAPDLVYLPIEKAPPLVYGIYSKSTASAEALRFFLKLAKQQFRETS